MNTQRLLIEYGHQPLHELPTDIRQQVESNPEALQYFERTSWINQALTIKQFETADEAAMSRISYNVETRIKNLRPADFESADNFTGDSIDSSSNRPWFIRMTPGLLFGATGVLAGMLFLHTLDGINGTNDGPTNMSGVTGVTSTTPPKTSPSMGAAHGLRPIATALPTNATMKVNNSTRDQ